MGFDNTTQFNINGVNVWEDKAPTFEYGRDRTSTVFTRYLRTAWADQFSLSRALRSGSTIIGGVTILSGAQQFPGYAGMFVDSIKSDGDGQLGFDSTNNIATAQWAITIVRYTPLDFTEAQTELDFGTETISLPAQALKFSNGDTVPQGASFRIPIVSLRQSKYNLPTLPTAAILNASANPVNSTSIFGAPAGKVLFDGGRCLMRFMLDAGWQYDISYSFLYKSVGWGKLFNSNPTVNTWQTVNTADGNPILGASDLNLLFA